jgi:Glyoxalase/Bleomycin resistance protein/Dioxygenase superfamily
MSRFAGPVRQLGIIVRDLKTEVQNWVTVGIGPWALISEVRFDNFHYRGRPAPGPKVSIALAYSGPLQLEIIQQHDNLPSAYTEYLAESPGGVQHIANFATSKKDFDRKRQALLDQGLVVVHEGNVEGFPQRFVYCSMPGRTSYPLFEVGESDLPALRPMWSRLQQLSEGWDGLNPLRPIAEIFG